MLRAAAVVAAGVVLGLGIGVGIGVRTGAVTLPVAAEPPAASPSAATPTAATPASPSPSPTCVPAPLELRAAQTLVVGLPGVTEPADPLVAELAELQPGGVLLTKTNVVNESQVRTFVAALRRASDHGLLVATDEEPGRVSSFGDLLGRTSSARTLARRDTPEQVRDDAEELGRALAAYGVDLNLAPVADLDDGPAGGIIGDRSFSADPDVATTYSLAYAEGLREGGVAAAVKHFPGHGVSAVDSHSRLTTVDVTLEELREADLVPFEAHVDAGTPVVLFNHVAYSVLDPDLPASLSPAAHELLRDLGFEGVAMTDSLGMGAVNLTWPFPEAAVRSVLAGADAALATDGNHARAMRDALVEAVRTGRLSEERLDEAATRMLALKGEDPLEVTCQEVPEDFPTEAAPPPRP